MKELKHKKIEIYAIEEIKKKGKRQRIYGYYLRYHSEVNKGGRTKAGIGIAIQNKYIDSDSEVSTYIGKNNISYDKDKIRKIKYNLSLCSGEL